MKLTKRGERLYAALLIGAALLALYGIYELVGHIWYIQGKGYCWGTMLECMEQGL